MARRYASSWRWTATLCGPCFFASGVADVAIETGNSDYRLAANRFWDSTTRRRMAITGGVGPRQEHEAFGEDYELPNDGYYESCAACGLTDFARRMFLLERSAETADVLERVLYNAVLHGIELTGTNTYYQNPLSDRDRPRNNVWVCCRPTCPAPCSKWDVMPTLRLSLTCL